MRRRTKKCKIARRKSRKKRGGRSTRKHRRRKGSIMRRRRRHFMVGGGHYTTGGAGAQALSGWGRKSDFSKGFIAGYQSCIPGVHFQGYTHPI